METTWKLPSRIASEGLILQLRPKIQADQEAETNKIPDRDRNSSLRQNPPVPVLRIGSEPQN